MEEVIKKFKDKKFFHFIYYKNKFQSIIINIITIILFLLFLFYLILIISKSILEPSFNYYFFLGLIFGGFGIFLIYATFFKKRNIFITNKGLMINKKLIVNWNEIIHFYVKEPFVVLVTKYKVPGPYFSLMPILVLKKWKNFEISFNLGKDSNEFQKLLKKYIKEKYVSN